MVLEVLATVVLGCLCRKKKEHKEETHALVNTAQLIAVITTKLRWIPLKVRAKRVKIIY